MRNSGKPEKKVDPMQKAISARKSLLAVLLACALAIGWVPQAAYADDSGAESPDRAFAATSSGLAVASQTKAVRTIMLYDCGSNLETESGMASYNLRQVLRTRFSADDDVRFVVMTGGSKAWHLEQSYLYDPATGTNPATISAEYNQIWEAKGLDAPANAGQMVLCDGDGVSGDGDAAKKSKDELMSDPATLKAFINYAAENFPAQKYDLILWDHGGGPVSGFASDQHGPQGQYMAFAGILDALSDNAVIRSGEKFDFVDFDACVMGGVELTLAIADYADYYIASPETEPGYGQDYEGWLNSVGADPGKDAYEVGKQIVDDFVAFYDKESGDGASQEGTLAVVDERKLLESDFVPALAELDHMLEESAKSPWSDGEYHYYDVLSSIRGRCSTATWATTTSATSRARPRSPCTTWNRARRSAT